MIVRGKFKEVHRFECRYAGSDMFPCTGWHEETSLLTHTRARITNRSTGTCLLALLAPGTYPRSGCSQGTYPPVPVCGNMSAGICLADACSKRFCLCFFSRAEYIAKILPTKETDEDREEILRHLIHVASGCHDHDELFHLGRTEQHSV